jgi:predicted nucleotidyltransferase
MAPAIRRDPIGGPLVRPECPALPAHPEPRDGRERARPPGAVASWRPALVAGGRRPQPPRPGKRVVGARNLGGDRHYPAGRHGKARLYRINDRHLLAASLNALFEAEAARYARIREAMSAAVYTIQPSVLAAWIYGSVARGEDRLGSDLDLAVVAPAADLEPAEHAVREALAVSGEELGFVASVVGLDPDDVTRLSDQKDPWWAAVVADALVVLGPRPEELARQLHHRTASA